MTFLGEWGDRSQIATIAMAAGQDYWWVTGGAISGHAVCTAAAVIGGRAIAGRVSLRVGEFVPYPTFLEKATDSWKQLLLVALLRFSPLASFTWQKLHILLPLRIDCSKQSLTSKRRSVAPLSFYPPPSFNLGNVL